VQGLDGVKGREPVEPALVIRLGQVEVHVVVDGVAGTTRPISGTCRQLVVSVSVCPSSTATSW
jgi:hypothetical protein